MKCNLYNIAILKWNLQGDKISVLSALVRRWRDKIYIFSGQEFWKIIGIGALNGVSYYTRFGACCSDICRAWIKTMRSRNVPADRTKGWKVGRSGSYNYDHSSFTLSHSGLSQTLLRIYRARSLGWLMTLTRSPFTHLNHFVTFSSRMVHKFSRTLFSWLSMFSFFAVVAASHFSYTCAWALAWFFERYSREHRPYFSPMALSQTGYLSQHSPSVWHGYPYQQSMHTFADLSQMLFLRQHSLLDLHGCW